MNYRAFNNGLSIQAMPSGYVALPGEVLFDHYPVDDDLNKAFPAYAAAAAAIAATAAAVAAIGDGLSITSASTPALNGTYAIDPASMQTIGAVAAGIASRSRLPGGGSTFNYADKAGVMHSFSMAAFTAFAEAAEDYVYAVNNGQSPAQPVAIA